MERFYKSNKAVDVGRDSLFIVDNPNWNRTQIISIETLNAALIVDINKYIDKTTIILDPSTLKIKINDSFLDHFSVVREKIYDQHINPHIPPNTTPVDTALHVAIDKTYLYIWVEDCSRWKRIALNDF